MRVIKPGEYPGRNRPRLDLTGDKYGKLLVKEISDLPSKGSGRRWICLCDCGKETIVGACGLRSGSVKSCGCLHLESTRLAKTTHSHSPRSGATTEYRIWSGIKTRCLNKNHHTYPRYGGRGITISDEWRRDFAKFLSDMGMRTDRMSVDRIDNDGPYAAWNCRWATRAEQSRNKRGNVYIISNGVPLVLEDAVSSSGLSVGTVKRGIKKGRTLEECINHAEWYNNHRSKPYAPYACLLTE